MAAIEDAREPTTVVKCSVRKKAMRWHCLECDRIYYDLMNDYMFCPHCGREIVAKFGSGKGGRNEEP